MMRWSRYFRALLVLGFVPFTTGAAQTRPGRQAPAVAPLTATITGTVVDEAGLPVDSAIVSVRASDAAVVTGQGGAFRLPGLTAGKAQVSVTKSGFDPLIADFEIAPGVTVALRLTIMSFPPPMESDSAAPAIAADPAPIPSPAPSARKSTIIGTVIDPDGRPLFGATVEEASSNTRTMSDSAGRFRLQGILPGLSFVRVRKVGFLPEYFPLTAIAGRNITATVRLRPAGQTLAKVEVRADAMRADPKLRGFYERVARGGGVFIERTEILKRGASQVSDILRGRNGINVYGTGAGGTVIAGRQIRLAGGQGGAGVCPLPLILDGVLVPLREGLTIDRVVNLQDVRAIEVYVSGPAVPADLANGNTECGAVVVWTR